MAKVLRALNLLSFLNQEMSGDWCCIVKKWDLVIETSLATDGRGLLRVHLIWHRVMLFTSHGDLVIDLPSPP